MPVHPVHITDDSEQNQNANAVSVSLWRVADESTSQFMVSMYDRVQDKDISYAVAMTEVKRRFINGVFGEKYKSPCFWAPFVYYGKDYERTEGEKKYSVEESNLEEERRLIEKAKHSKFEDKHEPSNVRIAPKQTLPKENISTGKEKPIEGVSRLTKNVVLQRLGKPDTISKWSTTERWSYGTSYVEFENGIFTRCYEPHGRDDLKRKLGK